MAEDKWNEEEKTATKKTRIKQKFYFRVRITSTSQLHTD